MLSHWPETGRRSVLILNARVLVLVFWLFFGHKVSVSTVIENEHL